jgi:hypothetical protein
MAVDAKCVQRPGATGTNACVHRALRLTCRGSDAIGRKIGQAV